MGVTQAETGIRAQPRRRRIWRILAYVGAALLLLLIVTGGPGVPGFLTEPLRSRMESGVNQKLVGYRARLGGLVVRPLSLSIELDNLDIRQTAHPDPPVANFPRFVASVHWRALLSLRLVGDVVMDEPRLNVNLTQLRTEASDKVKLKERGWQAALKEIYPLEINEFRIRNGAMSYLDTKDAKPIELTDVDLVATNVRNVESPERTYPSRLDLDATVFGKGSLRAQGEADFLAEPYPGMLTHIELDGMPIATLRPALEHFNIGVHSGQISGSGTIEYSPTIKQVHLESATLDGVDANFLFAKAKTGSGEKIVQKVGSTVAKSTDKPEMLIDVDSIEAKKSRFGIVNRDARPEYRVFVATDKLSIKNFTNRPGTKRASLDLEGKFMDSGKTRLTATFLPVAKTPDLDVKLAIVRTDLRTLNPVWKAHADLDMAGGTFSFYTELSVRDNHIKGYVKPLFENIDVYDEKQEQNDSIFQKLYEGLVGAATEVLQNQPTDTVAARVDISGPVANPETSTIQILGSVLENAFIKAILPGLERHMKESRERK